MGRHTETFEVDGVTYHATHYSADKGMILLAKIVKLIGAPIAIGMASMDKEASSELLNDAVNAFTANLIPEEFNKMAKDILAEMSIDAEEGKRPLNYALDFSGRIGHLLKVLKKTLDFQYNDFLAEIVASAPQLVTKKKATAGTIKAI